MRAELQTDLRDAFRTLGKTVVLVTHDLAEAAYFADEVVLLRDGRIVQRGRPADFVRNAGGPVRDAIHPGPAAGRISHRGR